MSEQAATYGGHMLGNQYAKKYDEPQNASLSLRCNANDKHQWLMQAQSEGKSLNAWVIEKLNSFLLRTG